MHFNIIDFTLDKNDIFYVKNRVLHIKVRPPYFVNNDINFFLFEKSGHLVSTISQNILELYFNFFLINETKLLIFDPLIKCNGAVVIVILLRQINPFFYYYIIHTKYHKEIQKIT